MMSEPNKSKAVHTVVVIGAGIIGLTSAHRLQHLLAQKKSKTQVLLVAREWPTSIPGSPSSHSPNYASMWAGAHVRPIPATTEQLKAEAKWLKKTASEFEKQIHAEPWCGVTRTLGVEFLESPDAGYLNQTAESFSHETGLPGYRKYNDDELPTDVCLGFEYQTYCVNAPLYCQSLLRSFILQGGKTMHRELVNEWEAFKLCENITLVVNASGIGFGDSKYFPTRGQTVITDMTTATKTVTKQNKDGTWNFIIPRFFSGGTIVGGSKQPGNWAVEPDENIRKTLLAASRKLRPYATGCHGHEDKEIGVIADVVGRRPTREGGMRIEVESKVVDGLSRNLIHAYGAGGRGYEISWGVAAEVAKLAQPLLPIGKTNAKL